MKFGDRASPSFVRLCNAGQDEYIGGRQFYSEPNVEVDLSEDTGGVEEKESTIKLPVDRKMQPVIDLFANDMASPRPFAPVQVQVFEQHITEEESTTTFLKEGEIFLTRKNPDKNEKALELQFASAKDQLSGIRLGIQCTGQCTWTFGRAGCELDNSLFFDSPFSPPHIQVIKRMHVELRMINSGLRSQHVTLSPSSAAHSGIPSTAITDQPAGWWLGASIEKAGLILPVRDWFWTVGGSATNEFILGTFPPLEWDFDQTSETVVLVTGCSNTIQACRDRNNEINFGGLAHGMPAYNPMIDEDNRA